MTKYFRQRFWLFLLASILLHIAVGLSLHIAKTRPPQQSPQTVEITILSPPTEEELSALEAQRRQIVEQDQQFNDETPEDNYYLSQFNQRVERQTRAQQSGAFTNEAAPGAASESSPQAPPTPAQPESQPEMVQKKNAPKLSDLSPKFRPTPPPPSPPSSQAAGGRSSQTDDYLKDIETGMQTLLSTREFVYYSYYQRIREQLRQHWEPSVRERVQIIYKQGRALASANDLVTQVVLVLDHRGQFIRVDVIGASGVQALDEAAVEAFRAAAPFPNPPKGIVDPDGTIKIRWDFILEANSNLHPSGYTHDRFARLGP